LIIQPIVEGHGEVQAVPVLLRRFQAHLREYKFQIAHPIRRTRSQLIGEEQVRRSVRLAMGTPQCAGILIVLDSDDDCPATVGPAIQQWAQAEAGEILCQVVLATREYEAWFIAGIESLRSLRGIKSDATSHPSPEAVRDCKGALEETMALGNSYSPTVDQAFFTAHLDLGAAHRKCRSFRHMAAAFARLAAAAGCASPNWPPEAWL
jgi:hypothetical protein